MSRELLEKLAESFPKRDRFNDPSYCAGDCDAASNRFLKHAKEQAGIEGFLLAVDNPIPEPTLSWFYWGGHWRDTGETISHYMAYFPEFQLGVDMTARQFWEDCAVPMILSQQEIESLWNELPFGWDDVRNHEQRADDGEYLGMK